MNPTTPTTAPVVLGIDLATAGVRVLAVSSADGTVLASAGAALHTPTSPEPGLMEQVPDYLAVTLALIGRVTDQLGTAAATISALSITGTSGSVVPTDRHGRPVGSALLYSDTRAGAEVARLRAVSSDPISGTSSLARIGWLRRHTTGSMFLHTPDVVTAGLAGRVLATDTSHALKAGIDAAGAGWPVELLATLDVSSDMVPRLVHPGTLLGQVDDTVAASVGLPSGVRIVAGMTDGCTAQIASGAITPGSAVGVLGTTLVLKGVADHDVTGFGGAVYSHLAPGGRYLPGGAANTGGGVLASEFAGADFAALDAAAAAQGPSSVIRYPLTGVGERFPFADPAAVDLSIGVSANPTDRYRSILDGVAFAERLGLERMAELGVDSGSYSAVGGGSRSLVWTGIRATVLDRPISLPVEPSSGFGAAVLAASLDLGLPAAGAAMVRIARIVEPGADSDRLESNYHDFLDLLSRHGHLETAPGPA